MDWFTRACISRKGSWVAYMGEVCLGWFRGAGLGRSATGSQLAKA